MRKSISTVGLILLFMGQALMPGTDAGAKDAGIVHMKTLRCIDQQGIGTEAFSFLMPSNWVFEGGIHWLLDNPGMPAVAAFKAKPPNGVTTFEVFPNQAMFWTNNPMLLSTFPVGSRYFGAEVRPVAQPLDALTEIILPRFRGSASGLQIKSRTNLPELARSLGAGAPQTGVRTFADAAKIRIEYTEGGIPVEEEIFAVVEGFSFDFQTMQGMITNINWYVDYIFSFKAKKGDLDRNIPMFQAIVNSFKVNPDWFNRYSQTVDYLIQAQIRNIRSIGEISRIISRTSNEISDSMMQSYENRQQVYDRISENFSEYVRGTEHYQNPIEGREVELPGGYSHAWTSSGGEYILTDNPNYNPNVGSSQNWQEIQKK